MNNPRFSILLAVIAVSALLCAGSGALAQPADDPAQPFGESQPIPGRYIVVFTDQVRDPSATALAMMRGRGGELHFTYAHTIKGFAATIPHAAFQAVRMNPNVLYVEQDQRVSLTAVQSNAPWGLDRIDQRDRPLDGTYQYSTTAASVYAFIIDTGIHASHAEFSGRVEPGATAINDGRGAGDCNGHGTHVAGTLGGATWGVAKEVRLVPVRVLDCDGSGTLSGVVAGVDWVAGQTQRRPAVANMSLGGGASSSLDSAVAKAVSAGVTMVVAAGNSSADACNYSPAREATAFTVGATTSRDARASYSNFGTCLNIFAPGSSIKSAWHTGNTATATVSGTSMAAPHVAGVAALKLANNPDASPALVAEFLTGNASENKLSSIGGGSPNLLVHSLTEPGTKPEPEPEPEPAPEPKPEPAPEPEPEPGLRLSGTSTNDGSTWTAAVTLHGAEGATTSGNWSHLKGAHKGCTIGTARDSCSFSVSGIRKNVASVTYSDTSLALSVTISKP
jgi:aqualysin 1